MFGEITIDVIKNEIGIYWDESDTNLKISRYIKEGKTILNSTAGKELEYVEGTDEGRLLIAYVEYAYNKKSEYFKSNYVPDLQQLRLKHLTEECDGIGEN